MKKLTLLAGGALFALTSFAQESAHFVNTGEDIYIYNIMFENAPQHPNFKHVPRFTLIGKESKFYLGIGANVKFVGDFDWNAPLSNPNEFAPSAIPMSVAPGSKGQTLFSLNQSNIYWNFVIMPGSKDQIGLFFDVNFIGKTTKPEIAIHHAYLKYRGFTAGYVVSTFTDLQADPVSIDFAGPNAITFVRHPNISYNQKFGKDKMWSAQIGLDMPDLVSYNTFNTVSKVSQRMPDIPLYIQRAWADNNGWFRVSALFRDLQYRGVENSSTFGWGIKASGHTPIVCGLSATWQGVYGKGIASYINDLGGQNEDMMLYRDSDKAKMKAVPVWGAYGTLQYDFGKLALLNFTYSQVRAYANTINHDITGIGSMYKYGQYVTSNLIFNINELAQVGVEYIWGKRVNYDGTQNHDNRIMLMFNVSI